MDFQVGDKVIHSIHGLGDIVEIETKKIQDRDVDCFVVRTQDLTIWVPISQAYQHTLRTPTPEVEFESLFSILGGPSKLLPDDRIERKKYLSNLLSQGKLNSIGRVVRDLSHRSQEMKLSEEDKSTLERAKNTLLIEWEYSLSISRSQALATMRKLLNVQSVNS